MFADKPDAQSNNPAQPEGSLKELLGNQQTELLEALDARITSQTAWLDKRLTTLQKQLIRLERRLTKRLNRL